MVARAVPRLWDGRRLLQFLTGLALIALAFAAPALTSPSPAPEPATVGTVVDAPLTGTAVTDRVLVPGPADAPQTSGPAPAPAPDLAETAELNPAGRPIPLPGTVHQAAFAGRAPPA
ncbi:hypothetical protein L083_6225 [Actinoplanes sp. N902-109]|nr:hypothetical protein L083_6225 [Actinoplanes sp. N902-109]